MVAVEPSNAGGLFTDNRFFGYLDEPTLRVMRLCASTLDEFVGVKTLRPSATFEVEIRLSP